MSAAPLAVQTFVTLITAPNYVFPGYSVFIASLTAILTLQYVNKDDIIYPDYGSDEENLINLCADFIIVGTGSGGSTMAGRLAEIGEWSVLSIEAGKTPPLSCEVVKLFTGAFRSPYDWTLFSKEKRACGAQREGLCYQPRGLAVGGSPAINVMYYIRGSRIVYDRWRDKHKCPGWGFVDVLPYFKKSERNTFDWNDPKYHSWCGENYVSFYDESAPYIRFFEQAGNEMGIPSIPDVNAGNSGPGFVMAQGTHYNGRRYSVAKAFIQPIKRQRNYRLIQDSIVTKLIMKGKRVVGVEFVRNGKTYRAMARKEVILCAGAIHTPTIMLLSGIGPRDVLDKNGIAVVHESPNVGRNMADHVAAWLWYAFPNIKTTTSLVQLGKAILDYYGKPRKGLFAGIGTLASVSFETVEPDGEAIIECYHYFFELGSLDLPEVLRVTGYTDDVNNEILKANSVGAVALVIPSLLEPYSTGVVALQGLTGVDALKQPYMSFAYFSDPGDRDRKVLIKAMQKKIATEQTETFKKAGGTLIPMPFCFKENKYGSDSFCDCYLDYFGATIYHPVGTCKMGTDPLGSVINTRGQVHGLRGLRIADASVMPEITWGNTNAPTIMIAEKMADFIKEDYDKPTVTPGKCPSTKGSTCTSTIKSCGASDTKDRNRFKCSKRSEDKCKGTERDGTSQRCHCSSTNH